MTKSSPLNPRVGHSAVWTQGQLLIWGGHTYEQRWELYGDGAAYDPALDKWTPISSSPIKGLTGHAAVWAGDQMLIFGGVSDPGFDTSSSAALSFNPERDRWAQLKGVPQRPRKRHKAIWTGKEMIVWGGIGELSGNDPADFSEGFAYDPEKQQWRLLPPAPLKADDASGAYSTFPVKSRITNVLAWTGDEMLVWGGEAGFAPNQPHNQGYAYDPSNNRWRTLPESPLAPRGRVASVWTGNELIVWGGYGGQNFKDGAAYSPKTNSWRMLPESPLPPISEQGAAWTGKEMIVWGGWPGGESSKAGAAFDPNLNSWRSIPDSPIRGRTAPVVWTGEWLITWGGDYGVAGDDSFNSEVIGDGAMYSPG